MTTLQNNSIMNEYESCPICFEDMITKNISTTSCGHQFCLSCITKHICNGDNRCPMCRCDIIDKSDMKYNNQNLNQNQQFEQLNDYENTLIYRIIEASLRYTIVEKYKDVFPQHVYNEMVTVCTILNYHNRIYYGTDFSEYSIQTTNHGSVQVRQHSNRDNTRTGLIIPNTSNINTVNRQNTNRGRRNRQRSSRPRTEITSQRRCGLCRQTGHDRRRCPGL